MWLLDPTQNLKDSQNCQNRHQRHQKLSNRPVGVAHNLSPVVAPQNAGAEHPLARLVFSF